MKRKAGNDLTQTCSKLQKQYNIQVLKYHESSVSSFDLRGAGSIKSKAVRAKLKYLGC